MGTGIPIFCQLTWPESTANMTVLPSIFSLGNYILQFPHSYTLVCIVREENCSLFFKDLPW